MRNKYFIKEGNEELQKALLLMKYDSNKTLSENKEIISEQSASDVLKQTATGAAVGAAAGGIGGAGVGAIPGAIVGGIYGLVRSLSGGSVSRDKVKKLLEGCSKKSELGKTTLSVDDLDSIGDSINGAIRGLGTNVETIKNSFTKIPTIPDLCALVDNYNQYHGNLITDLEDDLEGDTEWRDYVYLPLRRAIRASTNITDNSKKETPAKTPAKTQPSEKVKKIQQMLVRSGYYIGNTGSSKNGVDGYYGNRTDMAYKAWNGGESAQDFNNRVYKMGKTTQQGGTQQGGTIQGGTTQGGTTQGGTTQGGTTQGGTTQGETTQGGTPQGGTIQGGTTQGGEDREINKVYPNEY
jgi:hypothetical protein